MSDTQKCEMIARAVANEAIESAFVRDLMIQKFMRANGMTVTADVVNFIDEMSKKFSK
jgi:hypothetical protein